MARFGGSLATPEEHAHLDTIDVLTGFCAAFASALALVKRERGGGTDIAFASLAAAGHLLQIPFMYDYAGRAPFNEPSGRQVKGAHALYRCYEAQDSWFFLAAKPDRQAALTSIPELADISSVPEDRLEAYLAERFRVKPLSYWAEGLQRLDMGVQPTATMADVKAANLLSEPVSPEALMGATLAFVRDENHPSGHAIELVAPNAVHPRHGRLHMLAPAAKYGVHSRELLAELGYDAGQVEELLSKGVVAESWSDAYLPD